MKIAVNTSCVVAGGGITHLRHLIPRLIEQIGDREIFLIGGEAAAQRLELPVDVRWVRPEKEPVGLLRRIAWENSRLDRIAQREGADVVLHPANFGPFRHRVPIVTVVHNLAPFLDSVKAGESVAQRVRLALLEKLTLRGLAASDSTIFLSHWGRELVLRAYGREPHSAPVIPFGAEHLGAEIDGEAARRIGLESGRFFLSVSHLYRYKRVELLIDASASLAPEWGRIPVVVAGEPYDATYTRRLRARAADRGVDARFIGGVGASEVAGLMSQSLALVFTSEAENLPLTLLEAMSLGCPIVTNRCCSMPEVCGDAALYASDPSSEGYAAQMRRLLERPALRDEYALRGRRRAAEFSWDTAAEQTLELLDAVVDRRRSRSPRTRAGS